ncbi:MAG: ATP-binding protein [Sphingomonadales bacterium]|nr:ATP-binding protein [Sphingomonadales bacterium]MDE2171374.1 ATP-binding protein [Sphingomonadales bacterium]
MERDEFREASEIHAMTLPSTIRPIVGQSLITRVTRLYNGTLTDGLHELLQNARRAGATRVDISINLADGKAQLLVGDDGCGIDDPAVLVTLGQSGWGDGTASREDPAGMGLFSLAGKRVTVHAWSPAAAQGWQVTIPDDGWEGARPLSIEPSDIAAGTCIHIDLPSACRDRLHTAVAAAALHFPLPVSFRGAEQRRQDFLDGALWFENGPGYRIGVFCGTGHQPQNAPRINFHGVTVPCYHAEVAESDGRKVWTARVDLHDAPALQLVLPARKEVVQNAALTALQLVMETAIYKAIAAQPNHRLPFKRWRRALELGVALPEARVGLDAWGPIRADNDGVFDIGQVTSGPMVIIPELEADLAQAAAPVLGHAGLMGAAPVSQEPAFEGYGWYDAVPRVTQVDVTFDCAVGSCSYGTSSVGLLPDTISSGKVPDLLLDLTIATSRQPDADTCVRTFDLDMMVIGDACSWLDDAVILVREGATVSPAMLADLIEASLYCPSDDADSDSWQTQNDDFCRQARSAANALLLGDEEALLARLREAIHDHVAWLIPSDRKLIVSAQKGDVSVTVALAD